MKVQGAGILEHLDKSIDSPKLILAQHRPIHRPKMYSEEDQSHAPN